MKEHPPTISNRSKKKSTYFVHNQNIAVGTMSVHDDDGEMEDVGGSHGDFFDHDPTKQEKIEVG